MEKNIPSRPAWRSIPASRQHPQETHPGLSSPHNGEPHWISAQQLLSLKTHRLLLSAATATNTLGLQNSGHSSERDAVTLVAFINTNETHATLRLLRNQSALISVHLVLYSTLERARKTRRRELFVFQSSKLNRKCRVVPQMSKKWHAALPKQRWEQAAAQPHWSEPSGFPGRKCSVREQQGTPRPAARLEAAKTLANWPKIQTGPATKHTDTEVTGGTTQSQRPTGCLQERTQHTVTLTRISGRPDTNSQRLRALPAAPLT